MVTLHIGPSKSQVEGAQVYLKELREEFKLRSPGYFYSNKWRLRQWDGYVRYITERGYYPTGLSEDIVKYLIKKNIKYSIKLQREPLGVYPIPRKLGKLELRPYQLNAVKAVVTKSLKGNPFPRGILHEATNAGKNLIAAALFRAYGPYVRLIFIINRTHIYQQAIQELGELLPGEIGWIGPNRDIKYNRFMVCMAQSLVSQIKSLKQTFYQFDICIVDECHYASSKTYKVLLEKLEYAQVRVGMSGTPLKHSDKIKNMNIIAYFGNILHTTHNIELISKGYSTPVQVTIVKGNTKVFKNCSYKEEEERGIVNNEQRNKRAIKRIMLRVKQGNMPILVVCKYHYHTEQIYKLVKSTFPELKVNYIHVKVKDRLERLEKFKQGKYHILVSSLLIKEGKNLPLTKAIVYLAAGSSAITILQVIGRLLRKHKSKQKVYFDDFRDKGKYLSKHTRKRLKEYKLEGFTIKIK
jgi:superfamily II DNA or RNA helicase